jgi:ionotropic glutamate receptor NMDA 2B
MTSLKITKERNTYIDFSVPFMETGIGIIVSLRPGSVSTTAFLSIFINTIFKDHSKLFKLFLFLEPYDYLIWIMLLIVTLHSVAVAVFAFEWVRNRICEVAEEKYSFIYLDESERWKVI